VSKAESIRETGSQSQEETSFLSDFSPSDIDPLQGESGEVDSLAEADVYVAYGRYRQAEELIRQAMEREPERLELKTKLFEILYAIKDKDGFIELAEQSVAEGLPDSDPEIWSRVVSMGSKMAPSSALFAVGDEALIAQESEARSDGLGELDDLDLETLDAGTSVPEGEIELDLGSETEDEVVIKGAGETEQVFSLDMETEVPEKIEEAAEIFQEADLDFSGLDLEQTSESIEALSEKAIPETDLSFDTGPGQDEAKPGQEVVQLDEDLPDLSLEDLEMEITDTDQEEKGEAAETLSTEFSDAGTEKAPEVEDMGGIAALELPEDDGGFDLDSIDQSLQDEVDTKLDLARAYVDMEDKEGARSILDEVLKEGNEDQKAAAEKMMVGLN
jgi:pilus assembly protein FimV